jgi:ABC-type oligopeptide transport system substrate-binding subunit/class 3 adenylate cyclase
MDCPACGARNPDGAMFCLRCGARLSLTCPHCGTNLPPGAKFCLACGAEQAAAPVPLRTPSDEGLVARLQRLVPKEYAERLQLMGGQTTPERRTVTMLFADVGGSTAMSENLDPEDVFEVMDGAFDLLIAPVYRYEGTLARLMGDAILAFFGAPVAHEDDPERAVHAALEITSAARAYAHQLEAERHIKGFTVRAGIHTGPVVVGEVGSDLRVEYTAMGDAVNLAARLEQHAPPGGILISQDTYGRVRGVFEVKPQPPLAVKGKAEPVQTYLVEGAKPRAFRKPVRGVEGVETRMVGREAELKHLQDAFLTTREDSELQKVTVTGEAGVGKSRLLHEFDLWAEDLPDRFFYFQGRAFSEMRDTPYGLLRNLLSFRFEIQDSDSPGAVRDKLEAGVRVAMEDSQNCRKAAHFLGHLAGLELGDSDQLAAVLDDAEGLRDQALGYLRDYFSGMAAQLPVLILLDDLHWADDSSLEALNHLALALRDQPVMIACAARPTLFERRPHWGEGQAFHSRLVLQPLSKWDSRRLVLEILQKVSEVPLALRDLIVTSAEGNPFFIEELVKMLVEDGVIVKGDESWQFEPARLAEIRVPETLNGVLYARLDRLPPEDRTTLQQASVVGRLFWDQAVAHIREPSGGEADLQELERSLLALRRREMVYQRETSSFVGSKEYIFGHALLREVTYESVLKRVRRTYHGLVADWLLERGGQRAGEITSLIADHLALAGRAAEAIDYLLRAGDRARNLYAHQEAVRAYRRALALQEELGDERGAARTLMKLGLSHDALYDFREAQQAYQEGISLWQRAGAAMPSATPLPAPHALRVAWPEPLTLDPGMYRDEASAAVIDHLFSGLVQLTPDLDIVPDVADSWDVSGGGRRYTFHLRGDVVWSDGVPVTAHDYAHAWRRQLDPTSVSPMVSVLFDVVGARAYHEGWGNREGVGIGAVDDRTLVLEMEEPTGYVLHLVAEASLYPVPRHVEERRGKAWVSSGELVSNGPYRLASWVAGEQMVLERNRRFHGRFEGNAERVELIHHAWCPTPAALELYENECLDVLFLDSLRLADRDRARQRHAEEIVALQRPGVWHLEMDPRRNPFDDLRVRRAIALGTDRERLVRLLPEFNLVYYTGGVVPAGLPGHSPDIALPYALRDAQRLLAEAGYPGGAGFPAVTAVSPVRTEPLLEALASLWHEALGLTVKPETLDFATFIDRIERGLAPMCVRGWIPHHPDPNTFLRTGVHRVTRLWRNERYEALVERAGRCADQDKRMELYGQADRMLLEEAVIVPLGPERRHLLIKPWVSRYPLSPFRRGFWQDVIIESH